MFADARRFAWPRGQLLDRHGLRPGSTSWELPL